MMELMELLSCHYSSNASRALWKCCVPTILCLSFFLAVVDQHPEEELILSEMCLQNRRKFSMELVALLKLVL